MTDPGRRGDEVGELVNGPRRVRATDELCELLGLDPASVVSLDFSLRWPDRVTVNAAIRPDDEKLDRIVGVLRRYDLTARDEP